MTTDNQEPGFSSPPDNRRFEVFLSLTAVAVSLSLLGLTWCGGDHHHYSAATATRIQLTEAQFSEYALVLNCYDPCYSAVKTGRICDNASIQQMDLQLNWDDCCAMQPQVGRGSAECTLLNEYRLQQRD